MDRSTLSAMLPTMRREAPRPWVVMAMASAGLPGFANFASELTVILGAWDSSFPLAGTGISVPGWLPTMAAIWGIVISATYLLRAVRDAWFGPSNPRWEGLQDARTFRQRLPFAGLILVLVLTGCFPRTIMDTIKSGVQKLRSIPADVEEAQR